MEINIINDALGNQQQSDSITPIGKSRKSSFRTNQNIREPLISMEKNDQQSNNSSNTNQNSQNHKIKFQLCNGKIRKHADDTQQLKDEEINEQVDDNQIIPPNIQESITGLDKIQPTSQFSKGNDEISQQSKSSDDFTSKKQEQAEKKQVNTQNLDINVIKMTSQIRENQLAMEERNKKKSNYQLEMVEKQIKQAELELNKLSKIKEPIFALKHKYADGSDSPAWKKKLVGGKVLMKKQKQTIMSERSLSLSSNESEENELPGETGEEGEQKPESNKQEENNNIQQQFSQSSQNIKIQTERQILIENYPKLFAFQVYDGYRPQNLAQTREYFNFLLENKKKDNPSISEENMPQHIIEYLQQTSQTRFPDYINQKKILRFDQNFECGNLDSVYLHREQVYNLLMKVDSNTLGNTYWFMFKVSNFKVGAKYKFRIFNFTRSIQKFYNEGMNVVTKVETQKIIQDIEPDKQLDSWRYNTCENIQFEQSELVKYLKDNKKGLYYKLSFEYTFKKEDANSSVYFAYAKPYSYTKLIKDLYLAQSILMTKVEGEESPNFKELLKEDYVDYEKYKNFYQAKNGGLVLNLTPNQGETSLNPRKTGNEQQKKFTKFDLQKKQMQKYAQKQVELKANKFENQFKDINDMEFQDSLNLMKMDNFEITNKYLLYRQEVIAQSIGGLNIYQITITKRKEAGSIKHRKKTCIYIQARMHCAETHGSFIMRHILRELTNNYLKYDKMLNNNIIKLIPMINPDGVVLGNSRSSLAGVDLNRRWSNPSANLHPEIYFLKNSMKITSEQSAGITIFCDLHGHNRQPNCFFYGCNKAPNEGLLSWTKTRLLPKIFGSLEEIFDFNLSQFSQEKTKYNTARVVVWNDFQVTNSFTLETSMFSKQKVIHHENKQRTWGVNKQMIENDFKNIGCKLIKSILQFILLESQLEKEFKQTGGWLKRKMLDEFTGITARQRLEQEAIRDKQIPKLVKPQVKIKKSSHNLTVRKLISGDIFAKNVKQSENKIQTFKLNGMPGKNLQTFKLKKTQLNLQQNELLADQATENKKARNKSQEKMKDTEQSPDKECEDDNIPEFLAKFFSKKELNFVIEESKKPLKTVEVDQSDERINESDSEPSCDNFDIVQINENFKEVLDEKQIEDFEKDKKERQSIKSLREEESNNSSQQKQKEESENFNFIQQSEEVKKETPNIKVSSVNQSEDRRNKKEEIIIAEKQKQRQKYVSTERAPTNLLPNQRTRGIGVEMSSFGQQDIKDSKSQDYRALMQKLIEAKQQTALLQKKYEDAQKQLQQRALQAYDNVESPEFKNTFNTTDNRGIVNKELSSGSLNDKISIRTSIVEQRISKYSDGLQLPTVIMEKIPQPIHEILKKSRNINFKTFGNEPQSPNIESQEFKQERGSLGWRQNIRKGSNVNKIQPFDQESVFLQNQLGNNKNYLQALQQQQQQQQQQKYYQRSPGFEIKTSKNPRYAELRQQQTNVNEQRQINNNTTTIKILQDQTKLQKSKNPGSQSTNLRQRTYSGGEPSFEGSTQFISRTAEKSQMKYNDVIGNNLVNDRYNLEQEEPLQHTPIQIHAPIQIHRRPLRNKQKTMKNVLTSHQEGFENLVYSAQPMMSPTNISRQENMILFPHLVEQHQFQTQDENKMLQMVKKNLEITGSSVEHMPSSDSTKFRIQTPKKQGKWKSMNRQHESSNCTPNEPMEPIFENQKQVFASGATEPKKSRKQMFHHDSEIEASNKNGQFSAHKSHLYETTSNENVIMNTGGVNKNNSPIHFRPQLKIDTKPIIYQQQEFLPLSPIIKTALSPQRQRKNGQQQLRLNPTNVVFADMSPAKARK